MSNKDTEDDHLELRPRNVEDIPPLENPGELRENVQKVVSRADCTIFDSVADSESREKLFLELGYIVKGRPDLAAAVHPLAVKVCHAFCKEMVPVTSNTSHLHNTDHLKHLEDIRNDIRSTLTDVDSISLFHCFPVPQIKHGPKPPTTLDLTYHGTISFPGDNNAVGKVIEDEIIKLNNTKLFADNIISPIIVKNRKNIHWKSHAFKEVFSGESGSVIIATGYYWRDNKIAGGRYTNSPNKAFGWKVAITSKLNKNDPGISRTFLFAYNLAQLISSSMVVPNERRHFISDFPRSRILVTHPAASIWENAKKRKRTVAEKSNEITRLSNEIGTEHLTVDFEIDIPPSIVKPGTFLRLTIKPATIARGNKNNDAISDRQMTIFQKYYNEGSYRRNVAWDSVDSSPNTTLAMALMRYIDFLEPVDKVSARTVWLDDDYKNHFLMV